MSSTSCTLTLPHTVSVYQHASTQVWCKRWRSSRWEENATLLITVNLPSKWLLTGLLAVNWLLIVIKIAAKIKFLTDGPWPQLNKSFHFAESVSVWETTLNFFMGCANLSPLTFMFVFFYFFLVEVSQPSSTALEDCIRAASVGPRGQMRGHAIPLWDICGFSTWPEPTPHTLRHPAFTFHKDWRRLSVSEEHGAKLNIFSLSVSLPSAFLPDSLRSFFSPPSSLTLLSWRLTTDCFFSPPQIPSYST